MTTYANWPVKGDDRAQPWETEDPDIGPRSGLPILAAGSADPAAAELFAALASLGYESAISRGETAHGVIGAEEMAAVRAFRNDYGVREDPSAFGGDHAQGRETADAHIGPWTFEAILRAHENAEDAAADEAAEEAEGGNEQTW